jgi:hypothetical protein
MRVAGRLSGGDLEHHTAAAVVVTTGVPAEKRGPVKMIPHRING